MLGGMGKIQDAHRIRTERSLPPDDRQRKRRSLECVIVETDSLSYMVADDLHKIQHFERAGELEPHNH